jgi:hypothetical protein
LTTLGSLVDTSNHEITAVFNDKLSGLETVHVGQCTRTLLATEKAFEI